MGKTALLAAGCVRAVRRGDLARRVRVSELETEFAFRAVRQLFERRLAGASPEEREALLAGPAAAVRPLLGGPVDSDAADRSFAVVHGLYWLAVNAAARRPLLLALDDAHWADEASARWLAYLARRVEGLPIALIAALRPSDPLSQTTWLAAVRAEATIIRPRPLSEAAVGVLIRAVAGEGTRDDVCAAVAAASGGNPFYVGELSRALQRDPR